MSFSDEHGKRRNGKSMLHRDHYSQQTMLHRDDSFHTWLVEGVGIPFLFVIPAQHHCPDSHIGPPYSRTSRSEGLVTTFHYLTVKREHQSSFLYYQKYDVPVTWNISSRLKFHDQTINWLYLTKCDIDGNVGYSSWTTYSPWNKYAWYMSFFFVMSWCQESWDPETSRQNKIITQPPDSPGPTSVVLCQGSVDFRSMLVRAAV